jgi:segregation and condensation protein B
MTDTPQLPMVAQADWAHQVRLLEALLFASSVPLTPAQLQARLGAGADIPALVAELQRFYSARGVQLMAVAGGWAFRTAPDLAGALNLERTEPRKLSRAALEVLAIIAYHQPITRAEIEAIRGVATSRGTLDILLETAWIRPGKRKRTPGRPVTWLTTDRFLDQFGLDTVAALPGVDELRAAGLLDAPSMSLPLPLGDENDAGADDPEGDDPQC